MGALKDIYKRRMGGFVVLFTCFPLCAAGQSLDGDVDGPQDLSSQPTRLPVIGSESQTETNFFDMLSVSWVLGVFFILVILLLNYKLNRKNGVLQRRLDKLMAHVNEQSSREALEQEIISSQQRYAALFNAADDAIFIIENDAVIDCNDAAAQMFACSRSMILHQSLFHWSAAFQPDGFDSQDKLNDILSSVKSGEPQLFDWLYRRGDGREFDAEVSLTYCDGGDKSYILAIVRDVSERKRVDSLKDEFISTVSHEIRTPLTSILGSLKLVLSGQLKDREQEMPMLQIARNNAERLLDLVNDLLDIQKLASKHSQLSYEQVSVADFLHQAVENNRAYAEQYNVTFKLEDVPPYYFALIDQAKLMQVMNNLLSNAAKFSSPSEQVEITTEEIGFMLRISVIDHGVGIADEFQPHVFERFTQADSTSTRQVGGTGLGLNIAQAIVEQHGGQLGFTSKEGEGSTFYFDIPFESTQKNHSLDKG